MQDFKTPVSRLARLFKKARDNWKQKALDRQPKIRALEIKVRDLSYSRENSTQLALDAESQLKNQKARETTEKKNISKLKKPTSIIIIRYESLHHFINMNFLRTTKSRSLTP